MNYYKFNIGDYAAATRHLTVLEHGAYRLLLDVYYTSEAQLPADTKVVARKAGARTQEEVEAVGVVLSEFFTLSDDGWHHARCDAEIAAFHAKAEVNRVVGKKGGRPRKQTQTVSGNNPQETQTVSGNNPQETQTVSGNNPQETLTTNQEPLTNNHTPLTPQGAAPVGAEGAEKTFPRLDDDLALIDTPVSSKAEAEAAAPIETQVADLVAELEVVDTADLHPSAGTVCTTAGAACLVMKSAGIASTNPGSPKLKALLDAGATLSEFLDAAQKAVAAGNGNFPYALGIVAGERKRAAAMAGQLHQGDMPVAETPYQRSMRERAAEFAPSLARKAPAERQRSQSAADFFNAIEVSARTVGALK